MLKIIKTCLFIVSVISFNLLAYIPTVHAAAPKCYGASGLVNCSNYQPNNLTFQDDKCYFVGDTSGGPATVGDCADPKFAGSTPDTTATGTEGIDEIHAVKSDCSDENLKPGVTDPNGAGHCEILNIIVRIINVLSAIVGIVIVIMIAYAGIQYSSSHDNPQATAAAKARITNAIIALVFYVFMFAFLQWLVPGGIF